jgi:hypothetical protein
MNSPPSQDTIALSIVIPVRDEAGNVAQLAGEIHGALKEARYEVIFDVFGNKSFRAVKNLKAPEPKEVPLSSIYVCNTAEVA